MAARVLFNGRVAGHSTFCPRMPPEAERPLRVAPHCDPTVNLHDWLHVMRDGRLLDIWPIDARGH
jgi:3-hydroxy-D-aspartate aldolase